MLAALREHFPPAASWTEPEGGMAIWVRLPEGVNADALLAPAQMQGIYFTPGTRFYASGAKANTLRLSFTMMTAAQIEEGVRRLGKLVERQIATLPLQRKAQDFGAHKALV